MKEIELVSFTTLFKAVVKRRRFAAAAVIGGSLLSLLLAFILPKNYTADATILPSGKTGPIGPFGSALELMDIDLEPQVPSNSSLLFPAILNSRHIRNQLLSSNFNVEGQEKPLADILGKDDEEESLEALDRIIRISLDKRTGIIRIRSTTRSHNLSFQIVNKLVFLLEKFISEKRRTKAWFDHQFIREELNSVECELFEVEKKLIEFERNHRDCATSTDPKVIMEYQRLLRNLQLKHDIYIDLTKEVELADIELKKETPLVRILDTASVPRLKSGPRRKVIVILGGIASLFIGLVGPVLKEVSLSAILRTTFSD